MPVPDLDPASESMTQLRRAAGLLTAVGQARPASADPGVALLCLAAAEDLRSLGVVPPRLVIGPTEVGDAVGDALASLAAVPDDIFAAPPVLDAAANVRAARALLTDTR
jgi:hypothetical protein